MHESESSSSHSVLESKSSHKSLNLAHELDLSPSPRLEYYNTETERENIRLRVVSFGEDFNEDRVDANADSNDRFSFAIAIFLVVHRRRILVIVLSPPNNSPNTERCDWVNTNGVRCSEIRGKKAADTQDRF